MNKGTELKINVHIEPIGGVHLSECEFKCTFYIYSNKKVEIDKSEMLKVDDDNYICLVDTGKLGAGVINMTAVVEVPDGDFYDGYRKEVQTVCTGIIVLP